MTRPPTRPTERADRQTGPTDQRTSPTEPQTSPTEPQTGPTGRRTRRAVLALTGSLAATGLAGCLGGPGDDGSPTATETSMDDDMTGTTMDDGMTGTTMDGGMTPADPANAPRATIDRFSDDAGTLHVRSANGDLPGPDEPIDFDASFLAQGFGPDGGVVQYYDFDVQPTAPAPIYAFFRENGDPVEGQLNVVGSIPGDEGYNDFWRVTTVTVPAEYEANTITSASALMDAGYPTETTNVLKNCPIVPEGSTASMRGGDASTGSVQGWYEGQVVDYFLFEEASLTTAGDSVPLSPIYVAFNTNPGEDGGGPASGFLTEADSAQTHNVVATLPGDAGYSPLWMVNVYDNADFESVTDLESAMDANVLAHGAANVNCPVVSTP